MTGAQIIAFAKKNGPTILSGCAVIGTGITAYLAHKAGRQYDPNKPVKKQWKNYISTALTFAATVTCIAAANRIHLGKEAALAAAVAFYKTYGEDFEDAVFDKFSDAGLRANVMDEVNAPSMNMKLRIWEPYTKQYFEASQKEILWAELTANKMLQQRGTVTVNDVLKLYSDPKLKMKKCGDKIGWSWDDDMFNELSGYYYAGGWIDMCPQFDDSLGECRFVMEYGINPNDISHLEE